MTFFAERLQSKASQRKRTGAGVALDRMRQSFPLLSESRVKVVDGETEAAYRANYQAETLLREACLLLSKAVMDERDFETLVREVLTPALFTRQLLAASACSIEEMARHLSGNALQALLGRMATAEMEPSHELQNGRRWSGWERS